MSFVDLRPFALDVRAKVLLRDGEIEKIPMKTVEVLVALVERRGEVVTREELFAKVWPDTVVEEANLTVHVSLLRKVLDDAAPIETVPKRGYRIPVAKAPADVPGREAVLRGRYFWNKLTRRSLERAAQCFEEALAADPASATALSGLADTRIMQGLLGFELDVGVFARALGTAREAVLADPRCAEAHASFASASVLGAWDFTSAETALAEARRLAPARVEPLLWSGLFLAMRGAFLPAIEAARQAQALDPLSLTAGVGLGLHAYLTQQHQPEVEPIRLALDLEPDFAVAHWALGLACDQLGRFAEAEQAHREAVALSGGSPTMESVLARSLALAGKSAEAEESLRSLRELGLSPYRLATIELALGRPAKALDDLERGLSQREAWLVWMRIDPMLASLRQDARFEGVARQVLGS